MSYVLERPSGEVQISARDKTLRRLRKRKRPPCVLLIDDDAAIRTLCSVSLRALGIEVIEAEGGAQGLELARAERPDLVLLDVSMPGLDGFEVGEIVRRHRKTRHIPLMFLSGEADNDARARELGAIACLAKPFDPVALSTLIATVLHPPTKKGAWA
ncbi:MAG: twitching motility two-component system response regulator PilG [Gaiellaceae bacterium]|jgi:two-component system alkaline phosphatase synthesis response regulator PhoP|nr:twitching motility two-component system response regulator PilG [Gaiellaceae bacterium]